MLEYSGRLLTGIPELANQFSGLGISSTVTVSVRTPLKVSLVITTTTLEGESKLT